MRDTFSPIVWSRIEVQRGEVIFLRPHSNGAKSQEALTLHPLPGAMLTASSIGHMWGVHLLSPMLACKVAPLGLLKPLPTISRVLFLGYTPEHLRKSSHQCEGPGVMCHPGTELACSKCPRVWLGWPPSQRRAAGV